jgi:hypothetical protein
MFTAVILFCNLTNVNDCAVRSLGTPLRNIEQCEAAYSHANTFAEGTGIIFVAGFECINWGEPS